MPESVIKVNDLGKKYRIRHQGRSSYRTIREAFVDKLSAVLRPTLHRKRNACEDFWALQDVGFDIKQGERVGIIGRNGAGKSTLLKLLSRITEPTTGRIELQGRVSSLLEVGTGFHPELTGRENIYLNGTILGMTKREIDRKFDEIVAFAEIEKFLDTPAKRYSSGMYVRLAFSVAAHLDSEILVIDEVLAVGDATFQEKCLGKMSAVSQEGRTVLFVSHNMGAIKGLCDRGLLLKNGKLIKDGNVKNVAEYYISSQKEVDAIDLKERKDRIGTGDARIVKAIMRNSKGIETKNIEMGEAFSVEVFYEGQIKAAYVAVLVYNIMGDWILEANSFYSYKDVLNLNGQPFKCNFHNNFLLGGVYSVALCLGRFDEYVDFIHRCFDFTVEAKDVYATGRVPDPRSGIIYSDHSWEFK